MRKDSAVSVSELQNLDGSYLEGGGQIVRTALGLSVLLGVPFRVKNIRKGRKDAGLKAQHVHAIKALQVLCNAKVEGAEEGSTTLLFVPQALKPRKIEVDIGTAGSISLLLQALLVPLVFAEKRTTLMIHGGTEVAWSPSIDYVSLVLLPLLEQYADIRIEVKKRGYYPKGGGVCEVTIVPRYQWKENKVKDAPRFVLDVQGKLVCVRGAAVASLSLMEREVAERMAGRAKSVLSQCHVPVDVRTEYAQTLSPGCSLTLAAVCSTSSEESNGSKKRVLGVDGLGEREVSAEELGERVARKLITALESGAAVDEHAADQLIPYLGLVGGVMKVPALSLHAKTNMFVVEQFLKKKFVVEGNMITV